jgi:hypothetical protein
MTERKPSAGDDIFATWTSTEREVWNAWSQVEQDVSQPGSGHGCSDVLDALETSALQVARLQSAVVRGACDSLQATPLLPRPARVLVEQACRPLLSISGWQQHLVTAWFGMARHAAISMPTGTGPVRSGSKRARESAS